jgi:hypothetical protein
MFAIRLGVIPGYVYRGAGFFPGEGTLLHGAAHGVGKSFILRGRNFVFVDEIGVKKNFMRGVFVGRPLGVG